MTTSTTTASPSAPTSRPYAPPALAELGSIEVLTAGPNPNAGSIDQIVGLSGGFARDATS